MNHIRKIVPVSIFITLGLCLFGILFVVFEGDISNWWVNLIVPDPHIFQVDISRRTALQIYPNTEGIEWLGTKWTDDGKSIEIYNSRGQVYASKLMVIDPENAIYTNDIQTQEGGNILGLVNLDFRVRSRN
jgi:hypothetical protein